MNVQILCEYFSNIIYFIYSRKVLNEFCKCAICKFLSLEKKKTLPKIPYFNQFLDFNPRVALKFTPLGKMNNRTEFFCEVHNFRAEQKKNLYKIYVQNFGRGQFCTKYYEINPCYQIFTVRKWIFESGDAFLFFTFKIVESF